MNWGYYIGVFSVFQCVACSIGYAFARDWRHRKNGEKPPPLGVGEESRVALKAQGMLY